MAELIERGQGFKDGGADVREFRAAVLGDKVRPSKSLLLAAAMSERHGPRATRLEITSSPSGARAGRRAAARDDAAAAAILAVAAGRRRWGQQQARRAWRYRGGLA